jgi:hypothetical protein
MALKDKIRVRRDTTANFTSVNPVLAVGEVSFDTTAKQFKIGDGSTAWTSLAYANAAATATAVETAVKLDPSISSLAIATAGLGNWNTVSVGYLATQSAVAMTDSTFVGTNSGRYLQTGNGNTAVGNLTQATIVEGSHNTTVGDASGRYLQNAVGNTFVGYVSATEWVNGDWNVVLGSYAGAYNTDGSYNILIGGYAGAQANTGATVHLGDHNIGIGYDSIKVSEGNHIIAMGHESAYPVKGDNIISIGRQSGASLTSVNAEDCIFIGRRAGNVSGGQKADAVNVICIGTEVWTPVDNSVVIGDGNVTSTTLRGKVTGITGVFLAQQTVSGSSSGTGIGVHAENNTLLWVSGSNGVAIRNAANTVEIFKITDAGVGTLAKSLTIGEDGSGGERLTLKGPAANYRVVLENNTDGTRAFAITQGGYDVIKCSGDVYASLTIGSSHTLDTILAGVKTSFSGSAKLATRTLATLPSAASCPGERYQVSDSATVAYRVVFSNGSAWYYEGTPVAV